MEASGFEEPSPGLAFADILRGSKVIDEATWGAWLQMDDDVQVGGHNLEIQGWQEVLQASQGLALLPLPEAHALPAHIKPM